MVKTIHVVNTFFSQILLPGGHNILVVVDIILLNQMLADLPTFTKYM